MKRYAIVVVDYKCPVMLEEKLKVCLSGHSCYHTEKCPYQWGDSKGQLIRKVAQVLIKDEMKYCKWKTKVQKEVCWQNNMELAKEIVEFLGVE